MFTIVEESYSYKHDLDKLMRVMLFLRWFFWYCCCCCFVVVFVVVYSCPSHV